MESTIIEFVLVLIAHAIVGIYSSTLKYRKKTTCIIWGVWVVVQSASFLLMTHVLIDDCLNKSSIRTWGVIIFYLSVR